MKKILLFALLAVMSVIAKAQVAFEWSLGGELTLDQVKDGTTPFILARVSDGQVLVYGTNGNQSTVQSPTKAGNSTNAYYFKIEAIKGNATFEANMETARNAAENKFNGETTNDDLYLFRVYANPTTPWSMWNGNTQYIAHCNWTTNVNLLNGAKFGADDWYNTIWKVTDEGDGYSLQSQSMNNKNYLVGTGGPGAKTIWKFYSLLEKGEEVWSCPEGEKDITKLAWVQKTQGCTNNIGSMTDATVFGTDNGAHPISYVDLSDCATLKVYGPAGQRARFFINRDEFGSNYEFYADINEEGVGELDLASVLEAQGAEYIHLNGIKAASWGQSLQLNGITVIEKPWTCPEGEIEYTTLGIKGDNNIGKVLKGGDVVCGDQSNGDNYTDVTAYETVKFYGTPGAMLRVFANRAGGEDVTVGKNEQHVKIGNDGVGTLDVKAVMKATEKDYCRLSGVKIAAAYQGATVDNDVVIKGITVVEPSSVTVTVDEALTLSSNKILDFSEVEGVKAYIATACDGTKVTMTQVTGAVPANTGLVLVGDGEVTIPFAKTANVNTEGNLLVATTTTTNVPTGSYVLAGSAETLGWYSINAVQPELAAGKAYLTVPTAAKGQLQMVWGDDNVTAVEVAEEASAKVADNTFYTVAGVKVAQPKKGNLYIYNGKAIVF